MLLAGSGNSPNRLNRPWVTACLTRFDTACLSSRFRLRPDVFAQLVDATLDAERCGKFVIDFRQLGRFNGLDLHFHTGLLSGQGLVPKCFGKGQFECFFVSGTDAGSGPARSSGKLSILPRVGAISCRPVSGTRSPSNVGHVGHPHPISALRPRVRASCHCRRCSRRVSIMSSTSESATLGLGAFDLHVVDIQLGHVRERLPARP